MLSSANLRKKNEERALNFIKKNKPRHTVIV